MAFETPRCFLKATDKDLTLQCQSATNGVDDAKQNGNKNLESGTPGRGLQRTESEKRVGTDSEVQHRVARTGRQSQKSESGQIQKCNIVLRELGGSKYENEFVCSMLGNLAECRFYEGDVVAATLRFSTHEYQGQVFQEILATDIVKLN